ncbi:DNA cytosine methyltransferase [Bradyrhizobium sp. CCGUVB1N3]|uniref:DNA cytosine methyltransferase n=1 Tax=Bradyrhizobium sp. CCGUVB1N3 TaxID=2949629 RepID=UPI0020B3BB18|nr:DNA cytosine methyltransferase [Bradyrhizobium sp. CCGUVB1N3]MCP3475057.1 DNA cytosine methyltransferase [Bradyrhizobium sp. CCGUVB1N3]
MLKAISLFTGAGGLDLGFEAAGFKTRVAVEIDPICCQTLRLNRGWTVVEEDIAGVSSKRLLKAAGLATGEADVLIGGPPCQPFSKSGYWANGDAPRLSDPNANTLDEYLRIVRDTRPKALLLENVYGFAYSGKREGLDRILHGIQDINKSAKTNYKPVWAVLDAASYGVPQRRERIFVIASRDGREFKFPQPTHGENAADQLPLGLKPFHTSWDAIGDLPQRPDVPELELTGKWAGLLPSIPEGQNYLWHTPRGGGVPLFGWRTRYWSFLLKLAKDKPSWTVQAQPGPATGPFHWTNRKLSARELARLQTFPDDFLFDCDRAQVQRMLGNAVPSLLAEVLAREIRRQLLDAPLREQKLELMPPRRRSVPRRHAAAPVRSVYLSLKGAHPDHPGTALGPRARLRSVELSS